MFELKKKTARPLVSVIIPVYNVEKYLEECVDSVLNQTYTNLEILLIDDGSTDSSGRKCDEYQRKDKRIKVVHTENEGLGAARNIGIEICKGEYLSFVDSDDYLELNFISNCMKLLKKYNTKMSCGDIYTYNEGELKKPQEKPVEDCCFSAYEIIKKALLHDGLTHSASGKVYHKSLFENIRFPEGVLFEDILTTYYVFEKCDRVSYRNDYGYYYRLRKGSITQSALSKEHFVVIDFVEKIVKDMSALDQRLELPAFAFKASVFMHLYYLILEEGVDCFPEQQQKLVRSVKQIPISFVLYKENKKMERLKFLLFKLNKYFFYASIKTKRICKKLYCRE